MARGYPDFFGASTFPGYGLLQRSVRNPIMIVAGDTQMLHDIICKGHLFNGFINVDSPTGITGCIIRLTVDGQVLANEDPIDNAKVVYPVHNNILRCIYLDFDSLVYYVSIRQDIVFGYRCLVEIIAPPADNIMAYSLLHYYIIQ